MRCYFRRWIYVIILMSSSTLLYYTCFTSLKSSIIQSPFQIIYYQNHAYRILSPSFHYDSRGTYLNFAYFHVEQRSRVLSIDTLYDVPVSSQWKSDGHLYPIQIAQFGLSHWSRFKSNFYDQSNDIYRFEQLQPNKNNPCSSWYSIPSQLKLSDTFLHFTITTNTALHVQFLQNNIDLIYSTAVHRKPKSVSEIIIPIEGSPRPVNRHMIVDIEKSLKKSPSFQSDRIRIRLCGSSNSSISQCTIANQNLYNEQAFYSAVRWLLNNQDNQTGCWFIHIQKTSNNQHQYPLRMPWCSAMAQGQAASLLVRFYCVTKNHQHLEAIRRAIRPLWSSNITRAYFNDRFLWLEEYPLESSNKGLFVLNGCLYALIGLIDAHTVDPQPYLSELINQMLNSLHQMLPYYIHPTISNWSLYDLSHITMKSELNPASHSYHLVHITLLQCLSEIFEKTNLPVSQFFDSYARRFLSALM